MDEQLKNLIEGAKKQGATDNDIKKIIDMYIADQKKKGSSEPTLQEGAGVSPTRPTQQGTSSDTEPPTRAQASVALGGPTKLFGQEEEKRPTSIMYGNEPKKEGFVPPSTPIDTEQSIKYLEKKTNIKLGQKFNVEEQERNRKELERLKALKKKTPIEEPVEDIYTYQFNNIRDLNNYTSKAKEEVDAEVNNTGFLNVIKSGLSSAYNTVVSGIGKLADLTPQDISAVQIEKNPIAKEISEVKSDPKNSKLTEEEVNYKAYQLAIDNKAKSLRNSQTDDYLGSIPEDVKNNLQFNKVDELKTIDDNTRKVVKVRDFYIASLENDYIRLNQLQQTNQDPNEIANVENRIKSNTEYIKKLDKSIYGLDRKHGSAEEEVDLLKRNYDMLYNFSGRVTQQTLNTLVSTADMIADFALIGTPRNSEYINKLKKSKDELVTETVNDINSLTNDFRKDISEVNNVNDFMNWSSDVFGVQLPTLVAASTSGGLGVIGATSMAQKRVNMKQEVLNGTAKYDDLQMLGVPLLWGTFDVVSELPTVGILKKAGLATSAINADKVLKRELINTTFNNFLKTGKEYSKDQFKEAAGELFTNVSQNALDKYLLGKKEVGIFDNSEDILKDTFLMTSMLQSSPHIAGAVIKPFTSPEYTNVLDNNSRQILNLNKLIGDKNVSEEVKSVAKNKIAGLNAESGAIVNKVISSIDSMSDAGKSRIAKIEKEQSELRAKASEITDDKTIDVNTKKDLLNTLKSQFKLIEDERVNILSGKVTPIEEMSVNAPEVKAEEVKAEEVIVNAPLTEPTIEQQSKDVKEGNVVTFEYENKDQVPEVFKDKISSSGEINGKPYVKVTVAKSLADFQLQESNKPTEVKAEEAAPTETTTEAAPKVEVKTIGTNPITSIDVVDDYNDMTKQYRDKKKAIILLARDNEITIKEVDSLTKELFKNLKEAQSTPKVEVQPTEVKAETAPAEAKANDKFSKEDLIETLNSLGGEVIVEKEAIGYRPKGSNLYYWFKEQYNGDWNNVSYTWSNSKGKMKSGLRGIDLKIKIREARKSKPIETKTEVAPVSEVKAEAKPAELATEEIAPSEIETTLDEVITPASKDIKEQIARAKKAISKFLSNVEIVYHTTSESFQSVVGDNSRGYYDPATKKIHINGSNATKNTVSHEVFHAVILKYISSDKQATDLTNRMFKALAKSIKNNPNLLKDINKFAESYSKGLQSEEKLAEVLGYLASEYETLPDVSKNIIQKWIEKIAKMVGIKKFTDQEVVDFMNTIATKVAYGQEITEGDVGNILKKIDNNELFENEYVPTNGTVENTKSGRKSVFIDTVVKESDIIDPKTLIGKPLEVVYYDNFTSSPYKLKNRVSGSEIDRTGEGGPGYSYRNEIRKNKIVAAFTNVTKGLNLIQGIRSRNEVAKENAVVGVALQNKETGHLGNKTTERDFYSPKDGVISMAVSDKLITEDQAVQMLKGAVDAYGQTKKGSDSKSSLGFTSNDFSTLDEFYKKINSISFERRGTFNAMAIPSKSDLKITKSTKPYVKTWLDSGIPTLNEYYDATSEKYTKEAEPHDIVKYFDPNLNKLGIDSTVNVTEAEIKRAKSMGIEIETIDNNLSHTSYPVVLFGNNIGIPSTFHSVRDMSKDWNVTNPFFKAGRRSDKAVPVRIQEIKEVKRTPKVSGRKQISPENSSNYANMTEDGKGNFVFYHFGPRGISSIDPKKYGSNKGAITSKPEVAAMGRVGGMSQFYTMPEYQESNVFGDKYMIKVPMDKVYDFNTDPDNLYDKAKDMFKAKHPDLPFTANDQLAYITKLAEKAGYDMTVAEWNDMSRAQSTKALKPMDTQVMDGNTISKPFKENYESNATKGFESVIPTSKESKLKDVYQKINAERNAKNRYDSLYSLAEDFPKLSQDKITDMIESSDISQEMKDAYAEALAYEPGTRMSGRKQKSPIDTAVETAKRRGFNDKDIADYLVGKGYTRAQATNAILRYNEVTAKKLRKEDSVFTKDGRNKIITFLDQVKRRALSAKSFLPKSVFILKEGIEANIKAEAKRASYLVDDFNKLVKGYKGDLKALNDEFDKYLRGDQTAVLPDEFKVVAGKMRMHIDNLSQMLLRTGAVSVSQAETIALNLGQYINRSYQVFDKKDWAKQVKDEMKEAAKVDLRNMYRAEAESKAKQTGMDADIILEKFINDKIDELIGGESAATFLGIGKTGSKDLSIMKQRLDIPLSIRQLMGEYTDASQNYARTVIKIATLAENARFLQSARDAGMGVFFFKEGDLNKPSEFNVQIAGEGSETMNPLNGLFTTKEIADAFKTSISAEKFIEGFVGPNVASSVVSLYTNYMKLLSVVKWNKTIASVATHFKNVTGNIWFMLSNGYFNYKKYGEAFNVLRNSSNEQLRDKLDEYIRAGIIDQSAALGEIKSMFSDADFDTAIENRLKKNPIDKAKKAARWVITKLNTAYQLEDDFYKIVSYESEKDRYSNAEFQKPFDQLTDDQKIMVSDIAAENTKNVLPNYARIPGLVKLIKVAPVTGTFISFQAEAYRTAWNTVALAFDELSSKNKRVKAIGAKRLAGIAFSQSIKFGLMTAIGTVLRGGDDDDEEDKLNNNVREFVPEWSKKSDLALVEYGNGKFSYVDFGASDPHGGIKKAYNSFMAGDGAVESFTNGMSEIFGPFVKKDMLLEAITDINNNENSYGGKLYNDADTNVNKINAVAERFYKVLEPGSLTSARKVAEAENVGNELAGQLTGYKVITIDAGQQLGFKMNKSKDDLREAKRLYNSAFYKFEDGKITAEELESNYNQANSSQKEIYKSIMDNMKAASFFGVEDRIIDDAMEGIGKGVVNDLWYGNLPDMKQKQVKLTDAEFRAKYGERAFKLLLKGRESLKKGAR